jgi:hypothetical protein
MERLAAMELQACMERRMVWPLFCFDVHGGCSKLAIPSSVHNRCLAQIKLIMHQVAPSVWKYFVSPTDVGQWQAADRPNTRLFAETRSADRGAAVRRWPPWRMA